MYTRPPSRESSPHVTRLAGSAAELRSTRAHMAHSQADAPAAEHPRQPSGDSRQPHANGSDLSGQQDSSSRPAQHGNWTADMSQGPAHDTQAVEPAGDDSPAQAASLTANGASTVPREAGSVDVPAEGVDSQAG